jgi:ribosomal protein L37E
MKKEFNLSENADVCAYCGFPRSVHPIGFDKGRECKKFIPKNEVKK